MKYLEKEIHKQHKVIEHFKRVWLKNSDSFKSEDMIKSWFYEFTIHITYHFYTEEYFICRQNDADKIHRASHRQLLSQAFSVLMYEGPVSRLKQMVSNFFDKYLEGHMKLFDRKIKYDYTEDQLDYFKPDDYHGGFIVILFRKGYYSVSFGTLTARIAREYVFNDKHFDDDWIKFVDLTRGQYQTQEAVEPSKRINELEVQNGRSSAYYVVKDKISEFSAKQLVPQGQSGIHYIGLRDLLSNEALVDLLTSEVLEIRVVASRSFIDGYFEQVLENRL